MPRTLPWLKDQAPRKPKPAPSTPAVPSTKRLRIEAPPTSDLSDEEPSALRARARRERQDAARKAGRTPSTSPPPAPPSIELMRPGLSADDIYIMVEDEFYSTAQLFTSHLHHAEYVRLKNLARARPASRPTDMRTAMREETKQKHKAEARGERNQEAVEQMKKDARARVNTYMSDQEGEEEEADGKGPAAPWEGTSLHKLMTPVDKKNLTSLKGLHGLQSSTRAAKGYHRSDGKSKTSFAPQPTSRVRSSADDGGSKGRNRTETAKQIPLTPDSSSASSSDLDAPVTRRLRPATEPVVTDPMTLAAHDLFHPSKHKASILSSKDHDPPWASATSTNRDEGRRHASPIIQHSNDYNDDDEESDDAAAAARKRLQARRDRAAAEARKKAAGETMVKKANVNEIPTFLA
ncbi:MAG: hypothetical protein Q9174_005436 [Haloplaca sp. 1 TL-2023]